MWSSKRRFGNIGENVAVVYFGKHGFKILDRNYNRKWGEIDIVARRGDHLHFIEVKSISHVTTIRAEENMHPQKLRRLQRVVQTYLLEKHIDLEWQIDLAVVVINDTEKTARVEILENIF